MPSNALIHWQTDRLPRLNRIDAQNCDIGAASAADSQLVDENLRGYVMLLAAHFQGFCRDLHSECIQAFASVIPPSMKQIFQTLSAIDRKLDKMNAKYSNIKEDFDRLGIDITKALSSDPTTRLRNEGWITRINHLNSWRNYAAHHNAAIPEHGGPFELPTVQSWKTSCDGLARALDELVYDALQTITGNSPW